VKLSELRALVLKLCGVHLLDLEFIHHKGTYQGFVKGVVAMEQDLLTLIENTEVELFLGCPMVFFCRQMSKEEFEKVNAFAVLPAEQLEPDSPNVMCVSRLEKEGSGHRPTQPTSRPIGPPRMQPVALSRQSRPRSSNSKKPGPGRQHQPCSAESRSTSCTQGLASRTPRATWAFLLFSGLLLLVLSCGVYHDIGAKRRNLRPHQM